MYLSISFNKYSPALAEDLPLTEDEFINDFAKVLETYKSLSSRAFFASIMFGIIFIIFSLLFFISTRPVSFQKLPLD